MTKNFFGRGLIAKDHSREGSASLPDLVFSNILGGMITAIQGQRIAEALAPTVN